MIHKLYSAKKGVFLFFVSHFWFYSCNIIKPEDLKTCDFENKIVVDSEVLEPFNKTFNLLDTTTVLDSVHVYVMNNGQRIVNKSFLKKSNFKFTFKEDGEYKVEILYKNTCKSNIKLETDFNINSQLKLEKSFSFIDNSTFETLNDLAISNEGEIYFITDNKLLKWVPKTGVYQSILEINPNIKFTFMCLSQDQKRLFLVDWQQSYELDLVTLKLSNFDLANVGYFFKKSIDEKYFAKYKDTKIIIISSKDFSNVNTFEHVDSDFRRGLVWIVGKYLLVQYVKNSKEYKHVLWDVETGKIINTYNDIGETSNIAINLNENRIYYNRPTNYKTIYSVDFNSKKVSDFEISANNLPVNFIEDGSLLITNHALLSWPSLKLTKTFNSQQFIYRYHKDLNWLVYITSGKIKVFDNQNDVFIENQDPFKLPGLANEAAVSWNGKYITLNSNMAFYSFESDSMKLISRINSTSLNHFSFVAKSEFVSYINCYYFVESNILRPKESKTTYLPFCQTNFSNFVSNSGNWFVSGTSSIGGIYDNLNITDFRSKQSLRQLENPGSPLTSYQISSNEKIIHGITLNNEMIFWNSSNGTIIKKVKVKPEGNNSLISSVILDENQNYYGYANYGKLYLFDFRTDKLVNENNLVDGFWTATESETFSNSKLIKLQGNFAFALYNSETGGLYRQTKVKNPILTSKYYPDQKKVIVVSTTDILVFRVE